MGVSSIGNKEITRVSISCLLLRARLERRKWNLAPGLSLFRMPEMNYTHTLSRARARERRES